MHFASSGSVSEAIRDGPLNVTTTFDVALLRSNVVGSTKSARWKPARHDYTIQDVPLKLMLMDRNSYTSRGLR